MKILIVADFASWPGTLETSYERAFQELGCEVVRFDIHASLRKHCRLGRAGQVFNRFVPVEAWVRKANREMVEQVSREQPDLILLAAAQPVRAGALAQIQVVSKAQLIYLWPDPLVNLDTEIIACLPLFDLVGTYSRDTIGVFEKLGARRVTWLPLAADPHLHPYLPADENQSNAIYRADVSFIGGWRPEREVLLAQLGEFDLKIWGPQWKRRSHNAVVLRAWQGRPLLGREFSQAVAASKINLNIIDGPTGGTPNMRLFELCVAGGLQVTTPCPEMEGEFRDGEHLFYCSQPSQLPGLLKRLLADDALRLKVAQRGHAQVLARHTYTQRARQILRELESQGQATAQVTA